MKKIIILGAGQMGQVVLRMVHKGNYQVIGFADNNPNMQGKRYQGLPVYSVDEAVGLEPDGVVIAVAGETRTKELRQQLQALGYSGQIRALRDYMQELDIRGSVLELCAERIRSLPGDLAELGVYKGEFAALLNCLFPERKLYLFDTFSGFDERDVQVEKEKGYSRAACGEFGDTSVAQVLGRLLIPEQAIPKVGFFPETAEGIEARFVLVSLDVDLYASTLAGLQWFYPRMVSGGMILIHDYHNQRFTGVREAVNQFESEHGRLLLVPVGDAHGTVLVIHP